ncbi:bifunctional adenosylcobinamide kinase/adenosylcobinamide-phosphate guanylyltransferase [Aurantimonas aggregata]|uniref:Bifunctional adenosylcobalamin biosynthesis protein n=1 Tax=Aurantimonas aggregata TaxID=2047720 RepID=A0A6L9MJ70_9HYPH|nr:bifunctional adenosylcobinamide kinase/adenosylcobinamide-phosphate guanylyltransferase [Aurantimonas aggregata]NDV87706.1 bifunctional adenosylcobinamide kinase/adenosylcobinamide-phosphate guanylyltransferase [Aurantimonas aggregata]
MPAEPGAASRSVFVLGGARSGKSAFAERRIVESGLAPVYLATGQAFDAEMKARIGAHQARRSASWRTVEAPLDLVAAIEREAAPETALLVDCLTLWVTNLMLAERDVDAESERLGECLRARPKGLVVLVSNEVGLSIVPENAMARRFRDHAGRLHQIVAAACDEAIFIAAGLPLQLKG